MTTEIVAQIVQAGVSMTSLEIAELTGSRHDNVKTSIERLSERGAIRLPALQDFEEINNLGHLVRRTAYRFSGELGKRDSIVVVAQLSPEFTAKLVDRWLELEAQSASQIELRPRQIANRILEDELCTASLLGVPLHLAQLEAIKTVHRETGLDYRPLLALAPAQNNVSPEDIRLEPSDLAKRLNIKDGATVNKWLVDCGLQRKEGKSWIATPAGEPFATVHQWSTAFKSGYNLKWSLAHIRSLLPKDWPVLS